MNLAENGRVFWVTGLSGSGKTTLAKHLYALRKKEKSGVVLLDGDALREVFGDSFGYSAEARFKLAMTYAKLCHLLASQGLDVVCATISMFDKCREWNRAHLPNYTEIYLRVPLDVLKKRDQKNLYSRSAKGEIANVLGIDIPFEEPKNPDIIIDNDFSESLSHICEKILLIKGS